MCTSVPQIDVLMILMSTSFGPGTGTGTSVRAIPGPGAVLERACIILALILGAPQDRPARPASQQRNGGPRSGVASRPGALSPVSPDPCPTDSTDPSTARPLAAESVG